MEDQNRWKIDLNSKNKEERENLNFLAQCTNKLHLCEFLLQLENISIIYVGGNARFEDLGTLGQEDFFLRLHAAPKHKLVRATSLFKPIFESA